MDEPGSRRSIASRKALGRTHDAEGARQAILDAAAEVFAEHGFDGARVDLIAVRAGYNKSLIFQYFGDKLNLYSSVIRKMDDETRVLQNQVLKDLMEGGKSWNPDRLKDLLKSFMVLYFDFLVEHPKYMRILNWEMAEGWQTYSKIVNERDIQDLVDFREPLRTIEASGWLRSNIDPMSQMMIALFTNHLYLGLIPLLQILITNDDPQTKEKLAQIREFTAEFIAHGLIKDPRETGS